MHGGGSRGRWRNGWKGLTATGFQRLWWRSWRRRCWVNDREKPSTPGNAGSSATDGVVRRRRHTWPSAVEVKISGFDVVDGSGRIYVRSMAGGPGRGLSGATTRTRYWSPSSAGIGMVGERAVWAGQVVTFDMSGSGAVNWCGGPRRGTRTGGHPPKPWRHGL